LFAAGGVTPRGSLRALKHYRGKQLVEEVDAYDLLLHGVRSDLSRLENGDTLLVPSLGPQVTVDGMVRRPAIYELHGESSLADVLELAGGILPTATLRHIEVQRVEAHEKRTMLTLDLSPTGDADSAKKQLDAFKIKCTSFRSLPTTRTPSTFRDMYCVPDVFPTNKGCSFRT